MTTRSLSRFARAPLLAFMLLPRFTDAQPNPAALQALRDSPVEKLIFKPGVRDLGPATLANGTLYVGGPSGQAGLFALDEATAKPRWVFRPAGMGASVSVPPYVTGALVIAPFGAASRAAVIAVSTVTGKEVWRALDPSEYSAVVGEGDRVFVVDKECVLHALNAATGQQLWQAPLRFVPGGACTTSPVVRDGVVYARVLARAPEGTAGWPDARYLAAFDANTGAERWRHRPMHPEYRQGAEPQQPVITRDAVYFTGDNALYALNRATGKPIFAPVFIKRVIDGRERMAKLSGLIDVGPSLVAATEVSLVAFDKSTGEITGEIPGRFQASQLSLAVAGTVLYFQGGLDGAPAFPGTLHAVDLSTGRRLWSFTRTGNDPPWRFGFVLPVDGGLWVDGYSALLKLQSR